MPCTPPCPHCGPLYAAALEAVSHLTTDGVLATGGLAPDVRGLVGERPSEETSPPWPLPRSRTVEDVLRVMTPRQMADEIVRLDAVLSGRQPNIAMSRVPLGAPVGVALADSVPSGDGRTHAVTVLLGGTYGVQGASAPRYAVRWSTGGYIVYERDGGRTLTPEEVERALGVDSVDGRKG